MATWSAVPNLSLVRYRVNGQRFPLGSSLDAPKEFTLKGPHRPVSKPFPLRRLRLIPISPGIAWPAPLPIRELAVPPSGLRRKRRSAMLVAFVGPSGRLTG